MVNYLPPETEPTVVIDRCANTATAVQTKMRISLFQVFEYIYNKMHFKNKQRSNRIVQNNRFRWRLWFNYCDMRFGFQNNNKMIKIESSIKRNNEAGLFVIHRCLDSFFSMSHSANYQYGPNYTKPLPKLLITHKRMILGVNWIMS